MVKSQMGNLTLDLFFGHNLCFKYPNGSCKFILDIYILRAFQWYKQLFNPMGFDACNHFLKIRESIKTSTPKMGAHLGAWRFIPSHPPTLLKAWNVIPGLHSWPTPLQALALVTNPTLRLRHFCFTWSRPLILDASLCSMAFTSSCTFCFQFNF